MTFRAVRPSRRAASRREVLLPCQAVREHDFKLIADRMIDLSTEGMLLPLLSSKTKVLTGEPLLVSFSIPGLWIDAEATVARIVHGRRPCDDGLAAGIVFHGLPPASRAALAGFLHARRAPLPRRGPLCRLRRGEGPPQLADVSVMAKELSMPELVDPADVFEDDEEIDGLGVLRAVVGAWQDLAGPSLTV
jgi:hypothetical protein